MLFERAQEVLTMLVVRYLRLVMEERPVAHEHPELALDDGPPLEGAILEVEHQRRAEGRGNE